jgi:DNA-binding beta-propeller fold protein YncE/plastocyanin
MKKRHILLALLCLLSAAGMAQAANPAITFQATDNPGGWFECANTGHNRTLGCVPAAAIITANSGQKSLAVIHTGETIAFASTGQANTLHTAVSLIYPTGAFAEPFDVDLDPPLLNNGKGSSFSVQLNTPGLHVFFCDIHPYMFAAVIVDDNLADGLQLGKKLDLPKVLGITALPTASDLALRLVHAFFVITDPNNWQVFPATGSTSWNPSYPNLTVQASTDGINYDFTGNLNDAMHAKFGEPKPLEAPIHPSVPGVGQVWVNTQLEKMSEKTKPGTATAVNATTWQVERKVGLPQINMNNPHNMWTDQNQTLIYQTQWFDNALAVFNRTSGNFVRNIQVGPAPAHVMTRTNNDQVHVSINGGNVIGEYAPLATSFIRDIPMGGADESTHPHAHWMSADGNMMVTPNDDTEDSTLYDFKSDSIASRTAVGHHPIATGMMPDSSKYYVANFLDSSISVIKINKRGGTPHASLSNTINFLANYNPITGTVVPDPVTGVIFVGGLPIQTPISPDGKFAITANTLTATILIIDTATDKVVKMLPCDPGCHGVQFGAKNGGGYYAYVSSKFSNRMLVVDPDPNGVGVAPDNGGNAVIAGSVLLTQPTGTPSDGTVTLYPGMGGQGVLPIPVVYNGWVQNLPDTWKGLLTPAQQHPIGQ